MSVEINCDDCKLTIASGELTYCESCFEELKKVIDELEDKNADLERTIINLKNDISELEKEG